jgi:probable phosphoglycerate mutase
MTRFLLVRHGAHDLLTRGVIAGRQSGVHLNALGEKQAKEIAEGLSTLPIEAIYSSPLERACETAALLAQRQSLPLQIANEFNEIDFGDWTGCAFAKLSNCLQWQQWNRFRSSTFTPSGDSMLAVQARVLAKMSQLCSHHSTVAVFTHGDVIRAVVAHFLGVHLDLLHRIQVGPGSTSLIEFDTTCVRVRCVNLPAESACGIRSFFRANTTAC